MIMQIKKIEEMHALTIVDESNCYTRKIFLEKIEPLGSVIESEM